MSKWIGSGKKLLIKSTALAAASCLTFANLPLYAFAEENTDGLHNVSEGGETDGEEQEKANDSSSVYILFNKDEIKGGETKDPEEKDEESKDEETEEEETSGGEEIKGNEEPQDEKIKEEEKKGEEIRDEASKEEEIKKEDEPEDQKIDQGDNDKNTVSGNDVEETKKEERESVSGNDAGDIEKEEQTEKEEQEIINVVVPTNYTLALNPYRLPIRLEEEEMTTEQIISGTYGIVNKSSTDQIVTVSLQVEDHSGEELVFVDSAEEAEHAGMNVYAIYLAAVPANGDQILIDGEPVDKNVTGESLQNVKMTGAPDQAVALYAGTNQMSFQLSKAVYHSEPEEEPGEENLDAEEEDTSESKEQPENILKELDPDGKSVTAYTFTGVMNPNAEWEKLSGGIKLSVVYTYRTADGDEEIIEGTGAMTEVKGIMDET